MEKRKIIKRTAVICLAIVIVAAFTLCVFTKGFTDWRFGKELPAVNDLNNNVVVTPQEGNGGIRLMAEFLPEITGSGDDTDYEGETLTITATLSPVTTENKTILWSAAWTDAESEWASGKEMADYFALSSDSSESGESISLNCKKAFGEQITVRAESDEDETIFATCKIDFRKKIESLQYTFKKGAEQISAPAAGADGVYCLDYTGEEAAYTVECVPVYSDYTLDDNFSSEIAGQFTESFGYGEEVTLTKIELQAGLYGGGSAEPELSAEAEEFISRVTTSCSIGNWNACYGSANAAKTAYDALTPEDQGHPRVANAYQALSILLEHLQDGTILNEERAEAQAVLNSYQAPVSEGDFTGGIKIESEDALLTAAKACNDAGKGIAEFNITYTSEYGEYLFTFSLGYTVSSVTAARSMAVSLPAVVF